MLAHGTERYGNKGARIPGGAGQYGNSRNRATGEIGGCYGVRVTIIVVIGSLRLFVIAVLPCGAPWPVVEIDIKPRPEIYALVTADIKAETIDIITQLQ